MKNEYNVSYSLRYLSEQKSQIPRKYRKAYSAAVRRRIEDTKTQSHLACEDYDNLYMLYMLDIYCRGYFNLRTFGISKPGDKNFCIWFDLSAETNPTYASLNKYIANKQRGLGYIYNAAEIADFKRKFTKMVEVIHPSMLSIRKRVRLSRSLSSC